MSSEPQQRIADHGEAVDDGRLDLYEGIRDPRSVRVGCERWPEGMYLLNEATGELVAGRCKATNLCPYCARLYAVETAEMVLLDAMEDAPTIYACFTSRDYLSRAEVVDHLRQLRKAARRRWRNVRWFVSVEFTKLGRLHVNLCIKGVPVEDTDALRELLVERWCARVDAVPAAQCVKPITDEGGIIRYVALHFLKESQAPPLGWHGHRTSQTRDYLVRPASVMRQEAKRALRLKRLIWRGVDGELAELELQLQEQETWRLIDHSDHDPNGDRRWKESARRPFVLAKLRRRGATVPVAPAATSSPTRKGRAELPAPTRESSVIELLDHPPDESKPQELLSAPARGRPDLEHPPN